MTKIKVPRILILSASVGSGHLRAAQAIELALGRRRPDLLVRNVDVLRLATAPFRWAYSGFYLELIRHAPGLLGRLYRSVEKPIPTGPRPWYRLRVLLERLNIRPLVDLLESQPWDLVIDTFFLPGEIVASLRRLGRFTAPQLMVTTDFALHGNWVTQPCDGYCVATEEGAAYLRRSGVPGDIIHRTGIPIHPLFSRPADAASCRQRQGLDPEGPVVLFLPGGPRGWSAEATLAALLEVGVPAQVVVVTGRNEDLQGPLRQVVPPARHRLVVLGYTDRMSDLLATADVVVTKPGGLTVCEALARGAGLVLINPIPGQEERNRDYLVKNDAALAVSEPRDLPGEVTALLRDPSRLARLRANSRRLARPRAAFDVVEQALALLNRPAAVPSRPRAAG